MTTTTLWDVEWVASVPKDEYGDAVIDDAQYSVRRFTNRDDAVAFARSLLDSVPFGVADVIPVREVSRAEAREMYECGEEDTPWREGDRWFAPSGSKEEIS
jgi:hypothetical protein